MDLQNHADGLLDHAESPVGVAAAQEAASDVVAETVTVPAAQVASHPERRSVFSSFPRITVGDPGEGHRVRPINGFDGQKYFQQWQHAEQGRRQHEREQQLIAQLAQLVLGQIDAAGLHEDIMCMLETEGEAAQLKCNSTRLLARLEIRSVNIAGLLQAIRNMDGITVGFSVSYHDGQRDWSLVRATAEQVAAVGPAIE